MPKNFVVATMKKFNSSNLGGIEIHNERKTSKHSNKEIDPLRSRFNFDLVKVQGESYVDCVNKHISLNRKGSRKVRKDAIVLAEWVVSHQRLLSVWRVSRFVNILPSRLNILEKNLAVRM